MPSQFAQNLPSPSTFFSEFCKTTEMPSPLAFTNTPTSAQPGAFRWPPHSQYTSSPLAKHENAGKTRMSSVDDDGDIEGPAAKKIKT
jgi:MADS-box transcription factor